MRIPNKVLKHKEVLTSLDFLAPNSQWPPNATERVRLERYRDNQWLFEGHHSEVFKENGLQIRDPETGDVCMVELNWFKRLSTLWADLLFGEAPSICGADAEESKYLETLADDIGFSRQGHKLEIDASRYGDAIAKVYKAQDGKICLSVVPPYFWFPVVSPADMERVTHHVLAYPQKDTMLVEIHEEGRVEYRSYDYGGTPAGFGSLGRLRDVRVENTGIQGCLVQNISNLGVSGDVYGVDDYSSLTSLVLELETRASQNSMVLKRHGDPKMYGPPLPIKTDPETGKDYIVTGTYFPVDGKDDILPSYITWDAKLDVSIQQFNSMLEQFYMLSETSPAAFGNLKSGLAESGSALRRLLMASLAKVNRTKLNLDPVLCEVLRVAALLDSGKETSPHIEWKDGLPDDDSEETVNAATAIGAGMLSKKSAIKRLYDLDDDQAEEELKRIAEEEPALEDPTTFGGQDGNAPDDGE